VENSLRRRLWTLAAEVAAAVLFVSAVVAWAIYSPPLAEFPKFYFAVAVNTALVFANLASQR
jgi:hypothetical protein